MVACYPASRQMTALWKQKQVGCVRWNCRKRRLYYKLLPAMSSGKAATCSCCTRSRMRQAATRCSLRGHRGMWFMSQHGRGGVGCSLHVEIERFWQSPTYPHRWQNRRDSIFCSAHPGNKTPPSYSITHLAIHCITGMSNTERENLKHDCIWVFDYLNVQLW